MAFYLFYESDFYRIEVDEEKDLLRAEWLRPVDEKEMITGGTMLFNTLRDSGVQNAVANAKAIGALSAEAKEWWREFSMACSRRRG
ncbi:hypothetical protein ACD591_20080 [Rufibacter glacialis]|uniref:Uncharacterized protein n=1 Tax=Rufibacter glacialis TaxID=1259555 RepID=A0ABV4RMP3_9BACT|nr:hypothetical protein [Rufibacter glacialis]GGK85364.1 hypothetical protein GCM10011405_36510 [Rufibacter glacialis]